jgi:hypothetical protein
MGSGNRGGQVEIKRIDPIAWYTIPHDHEYSITASRITLHFPKGAGTADKPKLNVVFQPETTPGKVVSTTTNPPHLSKKPWMIFSSSFRLTGFWR